jgi:NAD(P)-dependent dehydrogenase (short-subunit alcohol dehydrogenase family)
VSSLALVTGASTGIGRATALRLVDDGWTVLAGVRAQAAGESLVAEAAAASRMQPIELDVTKPEHIARAAARVQELADAGEASVPGGLDALVNNAGVAIGGPLELLPAEDLRAQFDVNVYGPVEMTQALLPALRRARGRIVFMSSIGGRVVTPYLAPYSASKHAIEAIADSLRVELRSSGVQVALIEPASVATPIWDKGRAETERVQIPRELERHYGQVQVAMRKAIDDTERRGVPPAQVAATIAGALTARRMRPRYLIGREAKALLAMRRVLPDAVFDRVITRALGV